MATVAVERWAVRWQAISPNTCYRKVGFSRTTLSLKHVKIKRKNERGKQFNLNKKWEQEI